MLLISHQARAGEARPPWSLPEEKEIGVDSSIGKELAQYAGQDFARLRSFAVGVENGKFIHLNLDSFAVIRPLEYARGQELEYICRELLRRRHELTWNMAKRLNPNISIGDYISEEGTYAAEQKTYTFLYDRPEVAEQMLKSHLDQQSLNRLNQLIEKQGNGALSADELNKFFEGRKLRNATPLPGLAMRPANAYPYLPSPLDQMLASKKAEQRFNGVAILAKQGYPAWRELAKIAEGNDIPFVRGAAVIALGYLGHMPAIETLIRMYAKERSAEVKTEILYSLLRGRDRRAVFFAEALIKDPQAPSQLRYAAGVILGSQFSTLEGGGEGSSLFFNRSASPARSEAKFFLAPRAPQLFDLVGASAKQFSEDIGDEAIHVFRDMIRQSYLLKSVDQKAQAAFFEAVRSPEAIYTAFARVALPDISVGEGLFNSLQRELKKRNKNIVAWLQEQDPEGRSNHKVLLQLSRMGLLARAVAQEPGLAPGIAEQFFSPEALKADGGWDAVDKGAFIDTVLRSWPATSRQAFLDRTVREAAQANGEKQKRLAAFLKIFSEYYGSQLQPHEKKTIQDMVARVNLGQGGSKSLTPTELFSQSGEFRGLVAFDNFGNYQNFINDAVKRGYEILNTGKSVNLGKGPVHMEVVVLRDPFLDSPLGRRWDRLETADFLEREKISKEAFAQREAELAALQTKMETARFVAMRGEPWFMNQVVEYSEKHPNDSPRLLLLGACYSIERIGAIKKACPSCVVIANAGSGFYINNNQLLFATLEAIAARKDWQQVGAAVRQVLPQMFGEIIGPWHFGMAYRDQLVGAGLNVQESFGEALRGQEARGRQ